MSRRMAEAPGDERWARVLAALALTTRCSRRSVTTAGGGGACSGGSRRTRRPSPRWSTSRTTRRSGSSRSSYAARLSPRTRQVYTSTYGGHVAPRLGGTPQGEIDAAVVGAFQGDLIASGVGPHAVRKTGDDAARRAAAACGGGAADSYNPQHVVRKARLRLTPGVRPLAPVFPDDRGSVWTANGLEKRRQRRFGPLHGAGGLSSGRPYDLCHSFASPLLHEGPRLIYVAHAHAARKVVGVGSVGTRAWIVLMLGNDDRDPLFLQPKEAEASVLEPFLGKSDHANHGQRASRASA
jgi:hypothetical protein